VNTLTNEIYVANNDTGQAPAGGNLLSVIDGVTNAVTEVAGSGGSAAIALDPKADRIYVPDTISGAAVVIVGATNTMKSIPTGVTGTPNLYPGYGIVFNPATDVMFICDPYANSLILVDTATDTTTAVPVGNEPSWVAVNPVTNMAYVINAYDTKVSVVDGNSKTVVASIPTPYLGTSAIAVNPVTNKIYVAVGNSNEVIVIDGATNGTTVVPVGTYPMSIAVNPVTNKIYIVNEGSGTLSILDGSADTITSTLSIPIGVAQILVNPNTNTLYMPAPASATPGAALLVVNGATNQMSTVTLSSSNSLAQQIAINLQTNRIYADWLDSSSGTVSSSIGTIDGTTDKLVGLTTVPLDVAVISTVDQLSNQVYAASYTNNNYSVLAIDGATDAFATIPIPNTGGDMAVNPANGKVYFTAGNTSIEVITPNSLQQIPLTMSVSGVADSQTISTTNVFQTTNPSPAFTVQVASSYTSTSGSSATVNPPPTAVYYQVDGGAYSWTAATPTSSVGSNPASFNMCLTNIPVGLHTLYLFPAYGDESAGSGAGNGTADAVQMGNVQGVPFLIAPGGTSSGNSSASCASSRSGSGPSNGTSITVASSINPQVYGSSVTFTATISPLAGSAGTPSGTVTFYDGTAYLGSVALSSALTATFSTSSLSLESHSIRAAYSGNATFAGSASGVLVETIIAPTTIATTTTLSSNANPQVLGSSVIFTATVSASPAGSVAPTGTVSFFDGAAKLGTSALTSNLTATFVTSSLALGSHSITASYSGDTNFSGSTSGVLVESIVQPTPTATLTAISSSANPQALGAGVTFTATVKPSSSAAPSPTGSVAFFDGATALGRSNLASNLTATYTTSSLALGSHSITAAYSGDTNFATSTSVVLTESIEESITSGDFTLTAKPVSLTIISGKSGTVALTVAAVSGFQGTVNLSCANLPSNVSCSFQSQALTLNTASSQSTVLTLGATLNTQSENSIAPKPGAKLLAFPAACLVPGWGTGILLMLRRRRLSRSMKSLAALLMLSIPAIGLAGCGVTFNGYPETYKIVVSGSANAGQLTDQTTVTLTVQH
jgi:YVTN family beta-propeller protein